MTLMPVLIDVATHAYFRSRGWAHLESAVSCFGKYFKGLERSYAYRVSTCKLTPCSLLE